MKRWKATRSNVGRALAALGTTVTEVRRSIRKLGIINEREYSVMRCSSCPIAQYLLRRLDAHKLAVGPDDVSVVNSDKSFFRVALSPTLREVVARYDREVQ